MEAVERACLDTSMGWPEAIVISVGIVCMCWFFVKMIDI